VSTLLVRPPGSSDAEAVAVLLARVAQGPSEDAAELRRDWASLSASDGWLIEEDERVVGFAAVRQRSAELLDGDVATEPEHLAELVALAEARAQEIGARTLRLVPRDAGDGLEPLGFRLARRFLRLAGRVPARELEGQAVLEAVRPTAPALHSLEQRGFADAWGFIPESYGAWHGRTSHHVAGPAFVARIAGEAVGVVRCSTRYGRGWVNALAVTPEWRRRGIGTQLLGAAVAALGAEGHAEVGLEVDAANTAALRLYEQVGLRQVDEQRFYDKALG
jgi:ribosomal protein S18 acetylase RimI-like enzyme